MQRIGAAGAAFAREGPVLPPSMAPGRPSAFPAPPRLTRFPRGIRAVIRAAVGDVSELGADRDHPVAVSA